MIQTVVYPGFFQQIVHIKIVFLHYVMNEISRKQCRNNVFIIFNEFDWGGGGVKGWGCCFLISFVFFNGQT